jgi:hypothetical protein
VIALGQWNQGLGWKDLGWRVLSGLVSMCNLSADSSGLWPRGQLGVDRGRGVRGLVQVTVEQAAVRR